MGNVRSLHNKVDELVALTCFTDTELAVLTPDSHIYMDCFHLPQANRMKESGKKRGVGL